MALKPILARPDVLLLMSDTGSIVAAILLKGREAIEEIILHEPDPKQQLKVKIFVLQFLTRSMTPEQAAPYADVRQVDDSLAKLKVPVYLAPHGNIQSMLVAVHGKLWEKAQREISWNAEYVVLDEVTRAAEWHVTIKCQAYPFRFWVSGVTSAQPMPDDHPDANGQGFSAGILLSDGSFWHKGTGLLSVRLPQKRDDYAYEGHEIVVRLKESRACTTMLKESLEYFLAAALGVDWHTNGHIAVVPMAPSRGPAGVS